MKYLKKFESPDFRGGRRPEEKGTSKAYIKTRASYQMYPKKYGNGRNERRIKLWSGNY